ncbi:MAG TPA: glycosyltransferase [Bacteroidia bacterium]|nr:glycosyltransferase [Bacteroidia bacterium]
MKRILILSDINSSHTQKWCASLAQSGFHIGIFSLSFPTVKWYESFENVSVFCPVSFEEETFRSSSFSKLKYLKAVLPLKKVIRKFSPDIVHAHYATSYGIIGALAGFHPYFISAWGSDLMDFPYRNSINSKLIKYIFSKADRVLATSKTLAGHAEKFSSKKIDILPFGVDTNKFKPVKVENIFKIDCVVIGAVKSLEQIYGIDILIKAFAKLNSKYWQKNLRLLLVGSGSKEADYKQLVKDLKIQEQTFFAGRIPHNELYKYYNMIDIFVNASHNESFGVSVLEASACEKPVVLTSVGGLIEVAEEMVTGMFIDPGNAEALENTLEKLIADEGLRLTLGANGRKKVQQEYEFNDCLAKQIEIYESSVK